MVDRRPTADEGTQPAADEGTAAPGRPRRVQSQPCCRAARTASIRLRVPVFPIAADR